jgi:hypothetical protein
MRTQEFKKARKVSNASKKEGKVHFIHPINQGDACWSPARSLKQTSDVTKVTCTLCKKTKVYKEAKMKYETDSTTLEQKKANFENECDKFVEEHPKQLTPIVKKVNYELYDYLTEKSDYMVVWSNDKELICMEEKIPERLFKITITEMEFTEKRTDE